MQERNWEERALQFVPMRGGAQVKEALGFVTLLWNHPVLTGLILLIFTPPFFPLVVYFSPLLMSTALCVVALVSVGSQMEKIKAEGGPGQLENHLGREHGVSRWVPRDNRPGSESTDRENHRYLYANSGININVVPAPSSWTGANSGHELLVTRARELPHLRPEPEESHSPTSPDAESEEDWWDTWVKEYESRPGWGEPDEQFFPTPAIRTSTISQSLSQAPVPPTILSPITARQDRHQHDTPRKPIRQETREEKPPPVTVAAPVAAPVSVPVSVPVPASVPVANRQEVSRSLPPPPTTSTSRSGEDEVVVAVKESDLRPHVSLAPIRTSREKRDVKQIMDRIHSKATAQASEIQEVPTTRSVDVERVSDVQALQSIEKLLHVEMGGSNATTPANSVPRNADSAADLKNAGLGNSSGVKPQVGVDSDAMNPQLNPAKGSGSVLTGKGIAVEASKKNRNKITVGVAVTAEDVPGETALLRHLKTSRLEKRARASTYSPLPSRTSKSLMSETVLPPPQFSPQLLESLQPPPPTGFSSRVPNLSTAPVSSSVEKIPQWVYDGIPREREERLERAESQAIKQAETEEEKHIRAFEQAVKVLSYTRRRAHGRRPTPIQVDSAISQGRPEVSVPNTPSLTPVEATSASTSKETTPEQTKSKVSPHWPASRASSPHLASPAKSVVAEILPSRISEDVAVEHVHAAGDPRESDSTETVAVIVPTPRASPRVIPSAMVAASPQKASIAASPRRASRAASPQSAAIAASPRPASVTSSPQRASVAASPRPASVSSSPQKASVVASPRRASRALSPHKPAIVSGGPWPASVASITASSQRASAASSPQRASIAASLPQASGASSPRRASIAASPRPPSRAPSVTSSSPRRSSVPSSPSMSSHSRRRRHSAKHCMDKVAFTRIEDSAYYDPPSAAEKEKLSAIESGATPFEAYVPIEQEVTIPPTSDIKDEIADSNCITPPAREPGSFPEEAEAALRWGRSHSATRKSRRRLEPRRVVTSQDADMFSLKKSFSTRDGETKKFVDSTSDDERESVTPRASRRSMGQTSKPLVWRSRAVHHEDSD